MTDFRDGNAQYFGRSVASIGDIDGDGVNDLLAGAPWNRDTNPGGAYTGAGAAYILFMKEDGTARASQAISGVYGGLNDSYVLDESDNFGWAAAGLGDLDGDGVPDIVVGAPGDTSVSPEFSAVQSGATSWSNTGALYILFLTRSGTVRTAQKICFAAENCANLTGTMASFFSRRCGYGYFGFSVANIGDIDSDGVVDLAVGANYALNGQGLVYILMLDANGEVKKAQVLCGSQTNPGDGCGVGGVGNLGFEYDTIQFGTAVSAMGDFDGNGVTDLLVGAKNFDIDKGAVYLVMMESSGISTGTFSVFSSSNGVGDFYELVSYSYFGIALAGTGDLDNDGVLDFVTTGTSPHGTVGCIYFIYLNGNGTIREMYRSSETDGNLPMEFPSGGHKGYQDFSSIAILPNLGAYHGNGMFEVVLGSPVRIG